MNKSVLKKIANDLKIKLNGDSKAFIFVISKKFLEVNKIFNKDQWLRNFLNFNGDVEKNILNDYDNEFKNIECIGWLYQYFIAEEKEKVFNNLMKNNKAQKEDIPFATQLFTPDWIVKFLVDNSLGKIIENKNIEDIKFIDPCQGTGHILIYAFDVLYNAYKNKGYSKINSVYNILTKNLYGTDIDETVSLIAKLVLILKGLIIIPELFDIDIIREMNIICIKNANMLDPKRYGEIINVFKYADEYGSLLVMPKITLPKEDENVNEYIKQYKILNQKYDVVCTNPPYMGKKSINNKLSNFLKEQYPDTKSELYAAFIERGLEFVDTNGYLAMITIHSWMFISSFTKLREKILKNSTIITMLHTGAATFDDLNSFNVLATSFILKNEKLDKKSLFIRLADYYNTRRKT